MVAGKLDLLAVSEVGMLARVLIGAMVVLGFGTNVFAGCTCTMPGGECERGWSSGQVVFLGKVTADIATEAPVVEDSAVEGSEIFSPRSTKEPPMNHAVHFLIAESFRGEGQPGQDIVVHTGVDERGPRDGDCSYPFVVGVSYLVYASGVGDSLSTSICTFTSPEVAAFGVLRELRAIRDGQPVGQPIRRGQFAVSQGGTLVIVLDQNATARRRRCARDR
jgi:hypothetical protein